MTRPPSAAETEAATVRSGGVQSVVRAFGILESMADSGGTITLSQLCSALDLPPATIHRLIRTLVEQGYVRQEPSRQYSLGPKLIRLGQISSGTLQSQAKPYLASLVDGTGESANLAMLDGDRIVYVAQAQSRQAMRMFTEVGARAFAHCTAVGKAILAQADPADVHRLLRRTGMPAQTHHTITDAAELASALVAVAAQGYAVDDQEQELGVRCVAVAVPGDHSRLAMSVSGPATRMTDDMVAASVPLLRKAAQEFAAELASGRSD